MYKSCHWRHNNNNALCSECTLSFTRLVKYVAHPKQQCTVDSKPETVCKKRMLFPIATAVRHPTGPQPGGVPYAGRSQRRNRNQGALYQVQSQGQADNRTRSSTKSATSAGRDQFREEASGRPQRVDQDQVGSKPSSRNRIPNNQSSIRRASHDPTNSSGQDTPTKVG